MFVISVGMTYSPTNKKILFVLVLKKNYQRQAEELASVIIAAYDVDTEGHENISLLISLRNIILQNHFTNGERSHGYLWGKQKFTAFAHFNLVPGFGIIPRWFYFCYIIQNDQQGEVLLHTSQHLKQKLNHYLHIKD